MMKHSRSVLYLSALLATGSLQAADWTIGVNLGVANGETGTGDINHQLSASGLDARAGSSDDGRSAWQIRLGYDFTPGWGMELSYVDLGDVETTFNGSTTDIDAFLSASSDIHPNTADGLLVSGTFRHPLGALSDLNAVARVGAFVWSSKYRLDGVTTSHKVEENGTDLSFGLGLELALDQMSDVTSGFSLQLDWDRFGIDGEHVDLFSLGLSRRFK